MNTLMNPLKAKLWTARTPDRWHPIHVAGTDTCVALVAPDQRELAMAIEGLPAAHELLEQAELLVQKPQEMLAKVEAALAKLEGR